MTPSELETRSSRLLLPFESVELMILRAFTKPSPVSTQVRLSNSCDFFLILTVLPAEVKPKAHVCERIPASLREAARQFPQFWGRSTSFSQTNTLAPPSCRPRNAKSRDAPWRSAVCGCAG